MSKPLYETAQSFLKVDSDIIEFDWSLYRWSKIYNIGKYWDALTAVMKIAFLSSGMLMIGIHLSHLNPICIISSFSDCTTLQLLYVQAIEISVQINNHKWLTLLSSLCKTYHITLFFLPANPCDASPCGRGSCEADKFDYVCQCYNDSIFLNTTCVGK